MNFTSGKPHYEYLRKKWIQRHRSIKNNFWEKHGDSLKHFTAGSLGGLMLLSFPQHNELPAPHITASSDGVLAGYDQNS